MKFMPTRNKNRPDQSSVMVADLDALLTKSITFRLLGKIHTIAPLSVEQFIRFAQSYSEFIALQDSDVVTPDQLVECYYNMISSVCDSVSREDIKAMSQQQAAGLFQIMMDMHTGRLFADEKKTLEKVQSLISAPQI